MRVSLAILLASVLVCAAAGALYGAADEREYRARSYVIQLPSGLGGPEGLALARSEPVLRGALALAGEGERGTAWLRSHSEVESTSRLDLSFTVEAPAEQQAIALATGYAKSFRRAIPDDRGLPVRGRGARRAQRELGPAGWALLGGALGLGLGAALAIVREGVRRGSGRAPRRASRACAPR